MEAHRDDIMDAIYERDDSDAVSELVRHTRDVPVRVELLSGCDCINSPLAGITGEYVYRTRISATWWTRSTLIQQR